MWCWAGEALKVKMRLSVSNTTIIPAHSMGCSKGERMTHWGQGQVMEKDHDVWIS